MKRLMAFCLLLVAPVALAFDTVKRPPSIGVLQVDERFSALDAARAGDLVSACLRDELRRRGFDAFDAEVTFDQVARGEGAPADFYVEIGPGSSDSTPYGGAGIAGSHVEVSMALVVARVSGELRLYDGTTLELLANDSLSRRNTSLMPVSPGFGGRNFFAVFALPLMNHLRLRGAVRAVARDAADVVSGVVSR